MKFREITACSKLQVTQIKHGYQMKKKSSISKVNVACSNADLFSLYYEPWLVRNPDMFIIRGIFRTLEYSKVRRYLDPCQSFCKVFEKKFHAIIAFAERSFLDHFRCLTGF